MTESEKMEVVKIVEMIQIAKTYEMIEEVLGHNRPYENISDIAHDRQTKINTEAYDRLAKLFNLERPDDLFEKYFTEEMYNDLFERFSE